MTATSAPHAPHPPAAVARLGAWLQLAGGEPWWPMDPRPTDVVWRSFAASLARTPRFGGHMAEDSPHTYSVAQHCVLVAQAVNPVPRLRLHALLHDAHEAVIGDVPDPLQRCLHTLGGLAALHCLRDRTDEALWAAAGLTAPTVSEAAAIALADARALATERRDLLATPHQPWVQDDQRPLPLPVPRLRPWPWTQAADEWLTLLRALLPTTALVRG